MAKVHQSSMVFGPSKETFLILTSINITLLSKKDVVTGLPKLKYFNDQLCSSCEMSKAKRSSFKSKVVPSSKGRLNLLHMDLCGPMRDETPEVLKDFLTMIQRNLQAQVISVRTDRGTEFLNKTLHAYFKEEGIEHQTSTPRTPEQNGVVERRNRTMDKVLRTMLQILSFIIILGCGRSMDKTKITRKQSKASKHGHENQKSTKPKPQKTKALANFHLQGPFLQFPKVIYNLKERKERRGPFVQSFQTSTVLTVEKRSGNPFYYSSSPPVSPP
ncbi:retrovirus-related pol polyprotein from transposon TNT 1-94 [Tanacetum coccineum]